MSNPCRWTSRARTEEEDLKEDGHEGGRIQP